MGSTEDEDGADLWQMLPTNAAGQLPRLCLWKGD
jgi:hypothetical protein